jgi:sigma-B regulation protein RsbU (phosphoserine phosphatase)
LSVTPSSWRSVWVPRLKRFLQVEQGIVFIGVLISALFAVLKTGAPILFMGVCILTIGNLMYVVMYLAGRFYGRRPFPWNWIFYLPILALGSLASSFLAVGLLVWMKPDVGPYWEVFKVSLPIIMVISMGTGIAGYAVLEIQRKLQDKNTLLEQEVQRGSVALEEQEQELGRARDIQTGLLPKALPQHANLELSGAWQPARAIGGDYFDVVTLGNDRFGMCIGDVAGKGLTASLLMANLQAAFRAYATPEASPATVCSKLNAFVCGNVATGKFITFFYAIVDAQRRTLIYENAGHCPALLLHVSGAPELLAGQGGVLGISPEWTYADESKQLAPGDRLLLFTDGVTEAADARAVEFGSARIVQAAGRGGTNAADTKARVMEEVEKFCHADFHDDVTLLVAAIR